jgi:hypothetical protein
LFRCAPLHHHFQFLGWPENKIVVRFWIAAALFALIGVGSLKLGGHAPVVQNRFVNLFDVRSVYNNSELKKTADAEVRNTSRR